MTTYYLNALREREARLSLLRHRMIEALRQTSFWDSGSY